MLSSAPQRRRKIAAFAELIQADDGLTGGASKKQRQRKRAAKKAQQRKRYKEKKKAADELEPDEYRTKYGKCPAGWHFSDSEEKCIPSGGGKETKTPEDSKPSEPEPEQEPEPTQDTPEPEPKQEKRGPSERSMEDLLRDSWDDEDEDEPEPEPEPDEDGPAEPSTKDKLKDIEQQMRDAARSKDKDTYRRLSVERNKLSMEEENEDEDPEKMAEREREADKKAGFKTVKDKDGNEKRVPTKRQKQLEDLAKSDIDAYRTEVDKMRESGELPTREVATQLAKIKNIDDVPEADRNDPEKLKEVVRKQEAQKAHERHELEQQIEYLKTFKKLKERAEKSGKKAPSLQPLKMFSDLERNFGRDLMTDEDRTKFSTWIDDNEDTFVDAFSDSGVDPGSKSYNVLKWFEKLTAPTKPLKLFSGSRASVEGMTMSKVKRIQATLDEVAAELERRGSKKLAVMVDAEASGFPEADKMPTPPKEKPFDNGATIQGGDFAENLGYPPYDKKRPKVKGDEAED